MPDDMSVSNGSTECNSSSCTVAPTLSSHHSEVNDPEKLQEGPAFRHSIIQFAPKQLDQTCGYIKDVKSTSTEGEAANKLPSDVEQFFEEQEGLISTEISVRHQLPVWPT